MNQLAPPTHPQRDVVDGFKVRMVKRGLSMLSLIDYIVTCLSTSPVARFTL